MIVADSTPLIHLSKIGKLEILEKVFKNIIIPEAVYNETVVKGQKKLLIGATSINSQKWIVKKILTNIQKSESKILINNANIGIGEAEAIILAKNEISRFVSVCELLNEVNRIRKSKSAFNFRQLQNEKKNARNIYFYVNRPHMRFKIE